MHKVDRDTFINTDSTGVSSNAHSGCCQSTASGAPSACHEGRSTLHDCATTDRWVTSRGTGSSQRHWSSPVDHHTARTPVTWHGHVTTAGDNHSHQHARMLITYSNSRWLYLINKKHLKNVAPIRHCEPPHAACFTLPFTRCRYCRAPPAHRCPQQHRQQRQRVT